MLILLVLTAAYVSIGRILINTIDRYRADIEGMVSAALKVPVTIAELDGTWSYLDPKLIVRHLVVGTSENPAIELGLIELGVDTLASIIQGTLVVREIKIHGLRFKVRRDPGSQWHVEGLPKSDTPLNMEALLDAAANLTVATIADINIELTGNRGRYKISSTADAPFILNVEDGFKQLSWPLSFSYLDSQAERNTQFYLAGKYQGDPRKPGFISEFYLKLPSLELAEFLPEMQYQGLELADFSARGEFWLSTNGPHIEIRGIPVIESLVIKSGQGRQQLFRDFEIRFIARTDAGQISQIYFESLQGNVAGENWQSRDIDLSIEKIGSDLHVSARIPSLSLGKLNSIAMSIGKQTGILDSDLLSRLDEISLRGSLEQLLLTGIVGADNNDFKLTAKLVKFALDSCEGSPSVSNLDGFLSLSPEKGFFDIHVDELFELHLPALFSQPWIFDSAHTRIEYRRQNGELKVYSQLVELTHGELIARGRAYINLRPDALDHTWGLEIGVLNAELVESRRFLPYTVSEDFRNWLVESILGGHSTESGMVFHGALAREADRDQKAFEIFFKVEDTILKYDKNWPRFYDLTATIYMGNRKVHSDNATASVFEGRIYDSTILVPIHADGTIDTVFVNGRITGPASDGIRFLTETPVFEATNKMAEGWVGNGEMSGVAVLNIPLGPRSGEEVHVDLSVDLAQVDVYMPRFDIKVGNLNGNFKYHTDTGLSSEAYNASLFDRDVTGTISTKGNPESGEVNININGTVDVISLYRWSDQSLLSRADGILAYSAILRVPVGKRDQEPISIEATSDLIGVAIDLPEPMGKTADEMKVFSYRQIFLEPAYQIDLSLGKLTNASIKVVDDRLIGGLIHYGEEAMGPVSFDKVSITGALRYVIYSEWESVSEDLEGKSTVSLESELADTLDAIDVRVELLDTYGFELEDVATYVTRVGETWNIRLENEMLTGTVIVPDLDDSPLLINLDVMNIESESDASLDPLLEVDPREMDAIDFELTKLFLDGEDYGNWSFKYRPTPLGGVLQEFTAEVKGIKLAGDGTVSWRVQNGAHKSGFMGNVMVPDLSSALAQWGFASSIEGDNFDFPVDVSWPGSPAMVDIDTISGTVKLATGEGRFVQADSNLGALKLLGIFDFASLGRRFLFDFSDVVDSGFAFTSIEGTTRFSEGYVDIVEPIVIEGTGGIFKVGGRVDLEEMRLDNDMIITLPVNRNLPWYAAYSTFAMSPLTGAGVFIAQKIFQNQINTISSAKYKITGTVDDPVIEFVAIFSDSVREVPEEVPSVSAEIPAGE